MIDPAEPANRAEPAKLGRPPQRRVEDIPRVLRALRDAVQEALRAHKLSGSPVAIWRDGRVQWVAAEEIPVQPQSAEER